MVVPVSEVTTWPDLESDDYEDGATYIDTRVLVKNCVGQPIFRDDWTAVHITDKVTNR